MFTASLLGFIGANVIQVNAETLREEVRREGRRPPTWTGTFAAKAVLSLVLALLLGAFQALVAFGIYGLHREAGVLELFLFLSPSPPPRSSSRFSCSSSAWGWRPRAGLRRCRTCPRSCAPWPTCCRSSTRPTG